MASQEGSNRWPVNTYELARLYFLAIRVVTAYKKGAQEGARLLEAQRREIVNLTQKVRRAQSDVGP